MSYSALIVDDEPPARKRVADLLRSELDIRVVAQCGDVFEARDVLHRDRPELLFLDVQMPEASGFELLDALPNGLEPAVVFTTAHEQHAVHAFGVNAVDYLLKPFTGERFRKALAKARRFLQAAHVSRGGSLSDAADLKRRILVKDGSRIAWLRLAEIEWIEAAENYVVLHVGTARHFVRSTFHGFQAQLPKGSFVRVSRSAIIRASELKEIRPGIDGKLSAVLCCGEKIPITRKAADVRAELEQI